MNFNAAIFERCARQLIFGGDLDDVHDCEPGDEADGGFRGLPTDEKLNRVVGGQWWKSIERTRDNFRDTVLTVAKQVTARLRAVCGEAVFVPVKEKETHKVPKYFMIFGTRHVEGLKLMNDAMVKSRGESIFYVDLFSEAELDAMILEAATARVPRGELIADVLRGTCAVYHTSEIRGRIEQLLKVGRLESETGKIRINDTVQVWTVNS